jgi:hypothetical protein
MPNCCLNTSQPANGLRPIQRQRDHFLDWAAFTNFMKSGAVLVRFWCGLLGVLSRHRIEGRTVCNLEDQLKIVSMGDGF